MAAVTPQAARTSVPLILSLALILVYPFLGGPLRLYVLPLFAGLGEVAAALLHEAIAWSYAGLVLAIVLGWEGRPARTIGLGQVGWMTLLVGLAGCVATIALSGIAASVTYGLLHQTSHADEQAAAMTHGSVALALILAVRAGAVEELLYRGIAIEQLTLLTGRRWLGAVIAAALFILAHALIFDWPQLIPIAAATLVLTLLYLWRRDLWANMLAHVLVDAVGLVKVTLASGHGG